MLYVVLDLASSIFLGKPFGITSIDFANQTFELGTEDLQVLYSEKDINGLVSKENYYFISYEYYKKIKEILQCVEK